MNEMHKRVMSRINRRRKVELILTDNDFKIMKRVVKNSSLSDNAFVTAFMAIILGQMKDQIRDEQIQQENGKN